MDPDGRACVIGVKSKMESFHFFFGVSLGQLILNLPDNLSAALQSSRISAPGQNVAKLTVETLKTMRNDASFDLFWQTSKTKAADFDVSDPQLPRKRNAHGGINLVTQHNTTSNQWRTCTIRSTLKLLIW